MNRDIVIPYLPNKSGELEACIDLIRKNVPHRYIHVIDEKFHTISHVDQILKLKWAIENLDLTDEFYLFNDDFFVLEPIEEIPYFHRGSLKEQSNKRTSGYYGLALKNTLSYLDEGALSYELHIPFLFHKGLLKLLIPTLTPRIYKRNCPLIRSTYGNLTAVGGQYMDDVKNVEDFEGKTYLSTNELSFSRKPIGDYIRSKV